MAGTHVVGCFAQRRGWQVYANDQQHYSYVIGRAVLNPEPLYFGALEGALFPVGTDPANRLEHVIDALNRACAEPGALYDPVVHGAWFLDRYGEGGADGRLYFSHDNAKRIHIARYIIDEWPLTALERDVLLYTLLAAADRVSNTAAVCYTYLKELKKSARKPLTLRAVASAAGREPFVSCMTGRDFVRQAPLDVLYLDPPYVTRQYAANYHLWETLTLWDDPPVAGVGGVRPYTGQKSAWCSRAQAPDELAELVARTSAQVVLLSYSSEGLLTRSELRELLSRYGKLRIYEHAISRFRSDQDSDLRKYQENKEVVEYLFVLRKT